MTKLASPSPAPASGRSSSLPGAAPSAAAVLDRPSAPAAGARIPAELDRHLAMAVDDAIVGTAEYVERGGELVTPVAVAGLRSLRGPLQAKLAGLEAGSRLRRRLELLAQYFDEAPVGTGPAAVAHREAAFALLYFLKGFDRIPDSVPEVGLVDDAMVIQVVLDRHATTFQGHWRRRGRTWPAEI